MTKIVNYISRQRLPKYNSIEELFNTIQSQIVNSVPIKKTELHYTGGSPRVLFKNLRGFNANGFDIKHITGDVHYMALATGKNTVLTIHDVKSAIHGTYLRRFYILLLWFWLPAIFVKRITVISEFTKNELGRIIPFAKNKIRVVPNPVHSLISFKPKIFNKEKPTIMMMGTKPNKNLERSFRALQYIPCKLLIIGILTEDQQNLLKELKVEFINKNSLEFEEIVNCYESCDLLCFPSTYEGFGMPIIEAQSVGRVVLTSAFGAMKEVAGEGAYFVNPFNEKEIKKGIMKLIENDNLRERLIFKGKENVKRFNLEEIAEQYIKIYKEIAEQ